MISAIIEYLFITLPIVMATAPAAGFSGDKVWSDRKVAEERGEITAINIKKSGSPGSISSIRTR